MIWPAAYLFLNAALRSAIRAAALSLCIVSTLGSSGCVLSETFARRQSEGPVVDTVDRLTLVAAAIPMEKEGKPVPAGYSCRAYFFKGESTEPVAAEGDITINVTATTATDPNPKLVGVFPIPAERLASHRRSDVLGTVYVFWLPCEAPPEANIVFECRYKEKDPEAKLVVGDAALHPLTPSPKKEVVDNGPRFTIIQPAGTPNKPDVLTVETRVGRTAPSSVVPASGVFDAAGASGNVIPANAQGTQRSGNAPPQFTR